MERCTNPVGLQLDGLVVGKEVIGYGSFARVKRATWGGRPCAAKMLQEDREKSAKARNRFQNEGKLLSRLKHPNIVGLYSVSRDYKTGSEVLVLELLMQELRTYLQERKSISFYQKVDLCCDIAYGIRYLHSSQPAVLHRYLSDRNILVSWSNRAKIANFSRAREIQPSNPPRPPQRRSSLGGPATSSPYMPPEVHGSHPHYGTKVDIFSSGVLALQIDTQKPPDPTPETEERSPNFAARSLCKPMSEIDRRWEHIRLLEADDPLRKLILQCLEDNPEHRPTAPDLCLLLEEMKGSWKYAEYSLEKTTENDSCFQLQEKLISVEEQKARIEEEIQLMETEILQLREGLLKLHMTFAEQPSAAELDDQTKDSKCHQASDNADVSQGPTKDQRSSTSTAVGPLPKQLSSSSDTGDERPVCERSHCHDADSPVPHSAIASGPPSTYGYHTSSDSDHDHRFRCISQRSSISETGASSSLNSPWHGSAPYSKPPSLGDSRHSSTSAESDLCQSPHAYKRVHTVEWYAAARPVMIVGPLKYELQQKLLHEYPDRFSCCISYTTAPVQKGEEKLMHHVSHAEMRTLAMQGFFAQVSQSRNYYYGISHLDILQLMSEGVHCILPPNSQLVEDLQRKNISPIVICIIPSSVKPIMKIRRDLTQSDALLQLGHAHELGHEFEHHLTATVGGSSFREIYSEVKTIIAYHSGAVHLESVM